MKASTGLPLEDEYRNEPSYPKPPWFNQLPADLPAGPRLKWTQLRLTKPNSDQQSYLTNPIDSQAARKGSLTTEFTGVDAEQHPLRANMTIPAGLLSLGN